MCFSPCSPGNSAIGYLQRSSASPPSTSPQIKQQKLEDENPNPQSPASKHENLTLSMLRCSMTPLLPTSEKSELEKELIPTVNIVPSTPIQCTASMLPTKEEKGIMIEEKENNDSIKRDKVGLTLDQWIAIDHIAGYCELKKDNHSEKEHEHNAQPEGRSRLPYQG